ncbi:MAG: M20/M25/M40 family metallo-hydrolase [Candidatus Hodarchaeales archaeon]
MKAKEYFHNRKKSYLDDLFELLKIPSITQDTMEVKNAATWLIKRLNLTASSVESFETPGNPIIFAHWVNQNPASMDKKPMTILFYGHFDVQSPEPLEMWDSPPFSPEIREGRIYSRGAGDNKGQFFAHLSAIESLIHTKKLNINVKFVLDGEEEMGSPHLGKILDRNSNFFSDIALVIVSDGPSDPSWRPSLVFGARGIVTVQIEIDSAFKDVHSGNFGGIQPNPAIDLIYILNTMIDESGRCLIDGFYENIFSPDPLALEAADQLKRTPDLYKKTLGISYFGGEQDQQLVHRVLFRPTFNIRGIKSGEVRENAKTIIPKNAVVEIDMRLVPNQDPEYIKNIFLKHIEDLKSRSKRWEALIDRCQLKFEAGFAPLHTPLDLPWTEILEQAITEGFNEPPVKIPLLGGSLPIYDLFEITKKPLYIVPFGQPDQGNHAPNENLMVKWFENGVYTSISLLHQLSKIKENEII